MSSLVFILHNKVFYVVYISHFLPKGPVEAFHLPEHELYCTDIGRSLNLIVEEVITVPSVA